MVLQLLSVLSRCCCYDFMLRCRRPDDSRLLRGTEVVMFIMTLNNKRGHLACDVVLIEAKSEKVFYFELKTSSVPFRALAW